MHEAGARIDVWVVDSILGQGGMGSVYRCHNQDVPGFQAAVKVLSLRDEKASGRLSREANILRKLDHPSIVKVWDYWLTTSPPYMVMDLVEGERLSAVIRRGGLSMHRAIGLTVQIADALDYAHLRGVWHRDIKPSNILIQVGGRATLVDFGIALMSTDAQTTATREKLPPGTASYAPPEWLERSELDLTRWDIYSLGVVFWEALTGRRAFPNQPGNAPQQLQSKLKS